MNAELPPLPNQPHAYRMIGGVYVDLESFLDWHEAHAARERILQARIAELWRLLSDCVEHMEHSTPQGQSAWHAAHRAIDAAREAK